MAHFQLFIEYAPLALLLALLAVLTARRAYRRFPFFFSYALFAVLADLGRFYTRHHDDLYFNVYWATEIGYSLLGILVLYEIYRTVFRNLTDIRWVRRTFPVTISIAAILVAARSYLFPSQMPNFLMTCIVTAELAVRLLQVSIFVLLVFLVYFFGLRWRHHAFGIALGFGLYATVALISTSKFYDFGTDFAFVWGTVLLLAYSAFYQATSGRALIQRAGFPPYLVARSRAL
jgi:hypothetical protein